jgi:hypothetical protein
MAKQQINPAQQPNIKRNNNGTQSSVSGAHIETGWGVMAISTGTVQYSTTVTFNTAFVNPPVVTLTPAGDATTNSGATSGGQNIEAVWNGKVYGISNSSFIAHIAKPNLTAPGANGFVWYQWTAIGN